VKVTLWGTRGSLASGGPETVEYGGDTAAVELHGPEGEVVILDAGSGIRRIGTKLISHPSRIDILLTHLHMDHIQGLGFFAPLFDSRFQIHIWGPGSTTLSLRERLTRYLSPPLFPVMLRDLPDVTLHEIHPPASIELGSLAVRAELVTHPGPTMGYRIQSADSVLAYIPDHEPALGVPDFPDDPEWTSGYDLAAGADVLIHDTQYTNEEYAVRTGWGHSTFDHCLAFGRLAGVKQLVTFHHDPGHSDEMLDKVMEQIRRTAELPFELVAGRAGVTLRLE
jgi:phosphoribosyl 1,2-cyclic phosphodiesterase